MEVRQPQSDVAALWEEALTSYSEVAKVDIRSILQSQQSISSIMMEQQHQLETFKAFRHDKGKLDQFRSMISSNADIIQGAAKHVADAASAAFPPSSALLTAFTYVMNASKHVSDDYDMIEGFFGIMQSFLQRLSLLESKIPPQKAFQVFVINVFSSLLRLSGLARSYCAKGRLLKWAKALVDGKDPDLNAAYGKLNENLQRLESATIIQTLRTTIEISEESKSINQNVRLLEGKLDRNTAMTIQTLETSEQTLMIAMRTDTGIQELISGSRESANTGEELLRRQDDIMKRLDRIHALENKDKQSIMKSGASRPVHIERLKAALHNPAEGGLSEKISDMTLSYVDGVFEWIENEPAFESIVNNNEQLLWVSGGPGMGKSTLSFRMLRYLEDRYAFDSSTSVAWFSFDEDHPDMRSLTYMLQCCSIRAAEKDAHYCAETVMTIYRIGEIETDEDAWNHLVSSRYSKESGRRLILIIDGIDECTEESFQTLIKFMSNITTQGGAVQIIYTSDPDKMKDLSCLEAKCIDLNREKIIRDMRKIAWSKIKTLSKLRKLRKSLKKLIVRKVMRKADSFLYIEHTMRRFNALGREGLILKELGHLADSTTAIYQKLFEECQKGRTPEDRELLRNLLAWLAYTKEKFSIAEANLLIDIIKKDNSISIEEELDGRLSRLIRISGDRAPNEYEDSSESDSHQEQTSDVDSELGTVVEDANHFLSFQERSLKGYFRRAIDEQSDGLRCSAPEAQALTFRTCSAILTMPNKSHMTAEMNLRRYAVDWAIPHLLEIPPDDENISDELAKMIIEAIYYIFTNENDSLRPLESHNKGKQLTIFGGFESPQEDILAALASWARRALRLPPSQLPYSILAWFRPLATEPLRIFIGLSRAHIINWYSSENMLTAYHSFINAHCALQEGRNLPELKQNPILQNYFEEFIKGNREITHRSFEVVANTFWDIVKTSSSYRGIGMAMKFAELFEPAVHQLDTGLGDSTIDTLQRFNLLASKGGALIQLGKGETEDLKREQYLKDALSTLEEANAIYRKVVADKDAPWDMKNNGAYNFVRAATAAALLGRFELVIDYVKEEVNKTEILYPGLLIDVLHALRDGGQMELVIEVLRTIPSFYAPFSLIDDCTEVCMEAAKRTNQGQYILDLHEAARNGCDSWFSDPSPMKARVQQQAAAFAREALGDYELAKSMHRQVIDNPQTPSWYVFESCNRLAELLLEDFRHSRDPLVKQNALEETRKQLDKVAEVLPDDFDADESHLTLVIALMVRRFGPSLEYANRLQAAFNNCMKNLQDDTGANDFEAFRRLARVFSCVPGFERDAQIALTAQFYIVDDEVHRKDSEALAVAQDDTGQASEHGQEEKVEPLNGAKEAEVVNDGPNALESIDGNGDTPNGLSEGAQKPTNGEIPNNVIKPSEEEAVNEMDEGLVGGENNCFSCNDCTENIYSWSTGAGYLCAYCIDCDFCEKCYKKKIAREKGELERDWRILCPPGHRHIKAPIEGWRGVKDGKFRIGKEEIPFKSWLAQLEVRWSKYWAYYWMDEEML